MFLKHNQSFKPTSDLALSSDPLERQRAAQILAKALSKSDAKKEYQALLVELILEPNEQGNETAALVLFYLFNEYGLKDGVSRILKKCFERDACAQRTAIKTLRLVDTIGTSQSLAFITDILACLESLSNPTRVKNVVEVLMHSIIDPRFQRFGESLFESLVQAGGNQSRIATLVIIKLYRLGYMDSVVKDLLSRCASSKDKRFRGFAESFLCRCASSKDKRFRGFAESFLCRCASAEDKKVRKFAADVFVALLRQGKFEECFIKVAHNVFSKEAQETVIKVIEKTRTTFDPLIFTKNPRLFERKILLESAAGNQLLADILVGWMKNEASKKTAHKFFFDLAKSTHLGKWLLAESVLLELLDEDPQQAQRLWIDCCSVEYQSIAANVLRDALEKSCAEKLFEGLARFAFEDKCFQYESIAEVLEQLTSSEQKAFSQYQGRKGENGAMNAFQQYLKERENEKKNHQRFSPKQISYKEGGVYGKQSDNVFFSFKLPRKQYRNVSAANFRWVRVR